VVPTALLSTHTGEFTGYTHLDLSNQLSPIAQHLSTLHLHYDAFYSGYLANGAQADEVLHMMDLLCDRETHIFVDPAFGDHGRMYSLMDDSMPMQMRRLCERARTIVPNVTEAAFLTGIPYRETGDKGYYRELLAGMQDFGADAVIVTGIAPEEGKTGIMGWSKENGEFRYISSRIDRSCHGTGDLFAAVFTGALVQNHTMPEAATLAAKFVKRVIAATAEATPFGINFETQLPWLWEQI